MSGRRGVVEGALIIKNFVSYADSPEARYPLFRIYENHVEVKGLRFRGPSQGTSGDLPLGIGIQVSVPASQTEAPDIRIIGNEFVQWTHSGVYVDVRARGLFIEEGEPRLLDNVAFKRIRVARNYFAVNQRKGFGYGVCIGSYAYVLIEKNTFDYNRHAIAHTGGRGYIVEGYGPQTGYRASLNLVLPGHTPYTSWTGFWKYHDQNFDVHGTGHCGPKAWFGSDSVYNCGHAGEFFKVDRNSFLTTKGASLHVRGTPSGKLVFEDNVLVTDPPAPSGGVRFGADPPGAFRFDSDEDNAESSGTRYLDDARHSVGVGDFDGDGRDDIFLATGAAWFISSGARSEWRYLNSSKTLLDDLVLLDHDGDGMTDVARRSATGWQVASAGTRSWTGVATPNAVFESVVSNRGNTVVGDFDGDGSLEFLEFDRGGDRYFHVHGERYSRYPM
ncbi:MAG: hypothetical protein GY925_19065 [Actinomycetia bacterium]|nr:hypothetical protein [Actinomycetes bacterium]